MSSLLPVMSCSGTQLFQGPSLGPIAGPATSALTQQKTLLLRNVVPFCVVFK